MTTMPAADRVVVDTNVLLAATDEGRADHDDAIESLNAWPRLGMTLYCSGQILREYLAVATRPVDKNGLGMTRMDAVANIRQLRTRLHLLTEDEKVADRLLELLDTVECAGRQIHDANIVATALVHGVGSIVTLNVTDFTRFNKHFDVVSLRPQ